MCVVFFLGFFLIVFFKFLQFVYFQTALRHSDRHGCFVLSLSAGLNTTVRWVMCRLWPCCAVCSGVRASLRTISHCTAHAAQASHSTTPATSVPSPFTLSSNTPLYKTSFYFPVKMRFSSAHRMKMIQGRGYVEACYVTRTAPYLWTNHA